MRHVPGAILGVRVEPQHVRHEQHADSEDAEGVGVGHELGARGVAAEVGFFERAAEAVPQRGGLGRLFLDVAKALVFAQAVSEVFVGAIREELGVAEALASDLAVAVDDVGDASGEEEEGVEEGGEEKEGAVGGHGE